jgi:hypothetical protein
MSIQDEPYRSLSSEEEAELRAFRRIASAGAVRCRRVGRRPPGGTRSSVACAGEPWAAERKLTVL